MHRLENPMAKLRDKNDGDDDDSLHSNNCSPCPNATKRAQQEQKPEENLISGKADDWTNKI